MKKPTEFKLIKSLQLSNSPVSVSSYNYNSSPSKKTATSTLHLSSFGGGFGGSIKQLESSPTSPNNDQNKT